MVASDSNQKGHTPSSLKVLLLRVNDNNKQLIFPGLWSSGYMLWKGL